MTQFLLVSSSQSSWQIKYTEEEDTNNSSEGDILKLPKNIAICLRAIEINNDKLIRVLSVVLLWQTIILSPSEESCKNKYSSDQFVFWKLHDL